MSDFSMLYGKKHIASLAPMLRLTKLLTYGSNFEATYYFLLFFVLFLQKHGTWSYLSASVCSTVEWAPEIWRLKSWCVLNFYPNARLEILKQLLSPLYLKPWLKFSNVQLRGWKIIGKKFKISLHMSLTKRGWIFFLVCNLTDSAFTASNHPLPRLDSPLTPPLLLAPIWGC